MRRFLLVLCLALVSHVNCVLAEPGDPLDPFDIASGKIDFGDDENKTADELIFEGSVLLEDERPLDARSKLLKALQKDPKEYRAHLLLAGYYMVHVGHFRLALKYVRQAQNLFYEKEGKPPYKNNIARSQHQRILYLLSQARLSLDDYQGALDVLDEFTSYGYYADWYSGSRAWILMKLGRLKEAVETARTGIYSGSEAGRTLNMLGILLSMTGDRAEAIEVLRQAIAYELSLGKLGQPATPLNNIGEVYEEVFSEAQAQNAYSRATSMPDGCDHVLPSLNLCKLYLDELNFTAAKRTMDNFDSCIAQFPLRNGEEHHALVHLARGRIDLLSGHTESAVQHFREALGDRQWFGKIGTSEEDLKAAASLSLGQALLRARDVLSITAPDNLWQHAHMLSQRAQMTIEAWWNLRRGLQILMEDLNDLEDLYIRNTDSLIEYPTLGEVLSELPRAVLDKRIEIERLKDARSPALAYYSAYLAENVARNGSHQEALGLIDKALSLMRTQFDDALKLHLLQVKLSLFKPGSSAYRETSQEVFALSRPALRNHGFRLPVRVSAMESEAQAALDESPFLPDSSADAQYQIEFERLGDKSRYSLVPAREAGPGSTRLGRTSGEGSTIQEALRQLSDNVFQVTVE